MLTLDQLTRLREVCVRELHRTDEDYQDTTLACVKAIYAKHKDNATAALAYIDAEIELLKGVK